MMYNNRWDWPKIARRATRSWVIVRREPIGGLTDHHPVVSTVLNIRRWIASISIRPRPPPPPLPPPHLEGNWTVLLTSKPRYVRYNSFFSPWQRKIRFLLSVPFFGWEGRERWNWNVGKTLLLADDVFSHDYRRVIKEYGVNVRKIRCCSRPPAGPGFDRKLQKGEELLGLSGRCCVTHK